MRHRQEEHEAVAQFPWLNASLSVATRVALVLGAMTIDEKVAQLGYGMAMCESLNVTKYPHGIGGCMVGAASTGVATVKALRQALGASTRLGIPPSVYGETTHSGSAGGTTVFPMPCSQGASWNVSLVQEIGRVNALQLRASGGDHALSPVLQVCTDPRFGRFEENFAEDPFLVSTYGVHATVGLQGVDGMGGASSYLGSPRVHVVAQAKHYAVYGAGAKDGYVPNGGGVGVRSLFETYLRPWRDFGLAGGRGVMASHNLVDWVPMHANGPLLQGVLRGRFGLGEHGFIGSDNTNVEGLQHYFEGFAANASDAARMALEAGVDQDMPGGAYLSELAALATSGAVPVAALDRAAGAVIAKKFAARLFDAEPDTTLAPEIDSAAHRALSRVAAEEGSVLLRNRDATLPLDLPAHRRVAVIGPFADGDAARTAMMGGYSAGIPEAGVVTVADAWRARAAASGGRLSVDVSVGCGGGVGGPSASAADFDAAVALVEHADAVIVVLGTAACGCFVRCGNGEVGDRMALEPEDRQLELLATVANRSLTRSLAAARAPPGGGGGGGGDLAPAPVPVVAVLVHGRPLGFGPATQGSELPDALANVDALLAAWRPGEEGGTAIVNLLVGDATPSGKLAQAWQRHAGYVHTPTSPWFQPHTSMKAGKYFPNGDQTPLTPLFPFGWGLSYTSFAFDTLVAHTDGLPATASGAALETLTLNLTIKITNTGERAGAVVAMATYTKLTRGVVRPMKELCAFDKIALAAGEQRTLTLPIRLRDVRRCCPAAAPPARHRASP